MNDLIIKICGMREQADLDCAAALGVDLCGFIFAPQSPRAVTPNRPPRWTAGICSAWACRDRRHRFIEKPPAPLGWIASSCTEISRRPARIA
ncbi:MAG: hypothetical protein ACLSHC_10475 [Bilophila wadsworthia]